MSATTPSFLTYTPVALAFGTSGLRGLVTDITDLETYINVKGTLRYLLAQNDIAPANMVALAGDLRPSTDRILRASMRAVIDAGLEVDYAGKIPTPALIAHCLATEEAGIMVTGSHIPFDRNGIKINKSRGEILKRDEPGILRAVDEVRDEEYRRTAVQSAFDNHGMLRSPPDLPAPWAVAEESYLRRYVDAFAADGLRGRHIIFYQHSAVGRDLLPRILRALGAAVYPAGRSDTFIPIDTENITDDELARLEALVVEVEASHHITVDAVVSTDGDSDRPLVTAVLPAADGARRVRFLPGDLLGLVTASYLRADAAVVPISTNDAVDQQLAAANIPLQKSKIGSPYVIAVMDELGRRHERVVGWEANGGFLTGSDLALDSASLPALPALPTRDATLPILANLYAAGTGTLAELWDRLPQRFGRAGLLDNVPVTVGRAVASWLALADGTVEAAIDALPNAADYRARVARFFSTDHFGQPLRVNVLDGVRLYFASGDIAHIRPSGNAPQLRIYANAATQERADAIVADALREPDGILRSIERAFT